MRVTVAICTWNRCRLLDQTLTEMHKLRVPPGIDWELLVVDNNCTDDTETILARQSRLLPLRPLREATQGLCAARNCAVEAATGELLLWTDDDVLVHPDWLAEYVRASRDWPAASFFGGTVDPIFAVRPARWIVRHLAGLSGPYAIRQLGGDIRPFTHDEAPFGANMAYRMDVAKANLFDVRFGHVGKGPRVGEETVLLDRLTRTGHSGVWVGPARVRHYITADRLTTTYVWNWFISKGRMYVRSGQLEPCRHLMGAPRWVRLKYWRGVLALPWLAAFKGPRWFRTFRNTAVCRGIIEESQLGTDVPAESSRIPTRGAQTLPAGAPK